MNTHHTFEFHGQTLWALAEAAIWWPAERVLCVSDLHLGKSDRIARRSGRMLPPYETRATLERLGQLIDQFNPAHIVCLGDSFDDLDAAQSLNTIDHADIVAMQAGRTWTWIEGNHDPGPIDIGGQHRHDLTIQDITFRHIADPAQSAEISGHYHPKCSLQRGGSRPAFLVDDARIILPAFGAYTGGLRASDPALTALMDSAGTAILTGHKALAVPLGAAQ